MEICEHEYVLSECSGSVVLVTVMFLFLALRGLQEAEPAPHSVPNTPARLPDRCPAPVDSLLC